jgi:hypothetical protein
LLLNKKEEKKGKILAKNNFMKRLALLIGSPSDPKTPEAGVYLKGVKTDIENIHGFLLSSIGGSWQQNEIKVFSPNSNYNDVEPFLKYCESVDLAFIYFSGHGYTDKNNNARISFNSKEAPFVIEQIANRAKHQLTIIDACRVIPKFIGFDGQVLLEGIDFPNPKPDFAKAIYNNYISILPNTRVLLYGTSKGESSMDFGSQYGGLFSTSLLSVVKHKLKTENKAIFNVAEVFEVAKINTKKIQPDQVPQIYISDKNSYNLPFAINPNYNPPQSEVQKGVLNENNTTLIENIAKGTLISTGIILAGYIIGSLISGNKK